MINTLVIDLIRHSQACIESAAPGTIDDARLAGPLIGFSAAAREEQRELKRFLRLRLYQHYRVARMAAKSRRIVTDLFAAFSSDLRLLPTEYQERASTEGPRTIADYIAGMTDRYATLEHRRLFAVENL
jgi:dGTPase